jgi:hypothetical protein
MSTSLSEEAAQALTAAVEAGAEASAKRLSEATHDSWRVAGVALAVEDEGPFASEHASVAADHYGSHFTFPGGSFLVLFTGKSGYLITTAYTRDHQDAVENMDKREAVVLGEVANILLNPLVGSLAESWKMRLIISAPKTKISSPREHLAAAVERYRAGEPIAAAFYVNLASSSLFSECRVMLFLDREIVARISAVGEAAPP